MKRTLLLVIGLTFAILSVSVLYRYSRLALRTNTLITHVATESVAPQVIGYRATVTNSGYLPVIVGRCETVSDAMERSVTIGDALQRWEGQSIGWRQVVNRNECRTVPLGVIEAKFTRKMLWPGQQLHSSGFFANVGVAGSPFQHGDRIRFLLFPRNDAEGIPSPGFTID